MFRRPVPLVVLAALVFLIAPACDSGPTPTATLTPEQGRASDRAVLIAFYKATGGPTWVNSDNWLSAAPMGEWYGVRTDDNGRVTRLVIYNNQLSGEIPAELGSLSNLEALQVYDNRLRGRLRGKIPSELGKLSNLQLSGEIPSGEPGGSSGLYTLLLNDNQLSGCIPRRLRAVSNNDLRDLGLPFCEPSPALLQSPDRPVLVALYSATDGPSWSYNDNWLSEAPVDEWYGVRVDDSGRVTVLDIRGNQLSGEIPVELVNLSSLKWLWLRGHQLGGRIPPELGSLTNLQWLWLSDNQLSGEIPAELGSLSNLQWLRLNDNRLSGEIPSELGSLSNLRWLWLDGNQLSGEIPPELGSLPNLQSLLLYNNQLSGEIPAELGNLPNLRELYLSDNQLSGCIPGSLRDALRDYLLRPDPFCTQ